MTLALHGKSRQRQLFLILLALLTVGAAVFGGTIAQRAEPAEAAQNFVSVSFNGGSAPVNVSPGETIAVSLTVNLTGGDDWRCTDFRVGGGFLAPFTEVDFEPDFTTNGQHTHNFNITAPNSAGSYDLILRVSEDDDCSGGFFTLRTTVFDQDDAIVVQETPPAAQIPAPNTNPGGFNQCVAPNIMLVIDNSTSIGASELANMKTAVNSMIGQVESALPGTNWAGVHFRRPLSGSSISTPTSPWAGSTGAITTFVNGAVTDGYTPTANGINAAIGLGVGPGGQPPLMIIITDGDPNVRLGQPETAGTSEAAYVNGAIDAVTQANNAREGGWNTLLAFFGPGDSNAQSALGGDYGAYNAAVRAGLAGIPNGYPTGEQISVGNASGLAAAITEALLANCQGSVTINKLLDGQPANDWQFTATVSGGTAVPAGPYTTAGAGTTSFNVDFPNPDATATVSVTETGIGGSFDSSTYSFENVVCTGSENDGQHVVDTGTRTISGIEVQSDSTVTCTFNNTTNPTTGAVTIQKMVPNGQGGWEEHAGDDIWGFYYFPQPSGTIIPIANGATVDLAPGDYTFSELVPAGWQLLGSSFYSTPGATCATNQPGSYYSTPVQAGSASGRNINNLEAGDTHLVCLYNEPVRAFTFQKMVRDSSTGEYTLWDGGADFWGLAYQWNSEGFDYPNATPVENGETVFLPLGTHYVWEDLPEGWAFTGYSAPTGSTCDPSGPQGTVGATSTPGPVPSQVGVVSGAPASICFYNERNLEPVTVEKTGSGSYDVDWSLIKSVNTAVLNLPDDGNGTTDYTVQVNKSISNVSATGTITINNPNPVAIDVTVSDPGVTLGDECADGTVTVPASGNVQCSWTDVIGGNSIPTGYTNTVTVGGPWGDADVQDTTDPIVFVIDGGTEDVTVDDNFPGIVTGSVAPPNGEFISTGSTFQYTGLHTCSGINEFDSVTGIGTKTVTNTATISDDQEVLATVSVDVIVNCERPKVTLIKDVEGGDAQPGEWLLELDGPGVGFNGQSGVFGYVPSGGGPFTLTESNVAGYTLDNIQCVLDFAPDQQFNGLAGNELTMPGSQQGMVADVTCTFYNVADQALTVEKTASGDYDDVWDWSIVKTGDLGPLEYDAGVGFDVDYTTTSTPTITGRENGTVFGEVTITNSNNFDVDVTIADSLGDFDELVCVTDPAGTPVTVTDDGFTVPANDSVLCSYEFYDADTSETENTVTVTSTSHTNLGGGDTATISWRSRLNSADDAFLEDTDNQGSDPYTANYTNETATQQENYTRSFECPAWPSDVYYDNGVFTGSYTFDIVNTAVLYKNDNLDGDEWDRDDHTVAVTCTVERGSIDVQKSVDWNNVPEANQPDANFAICLAGPFEDMTAASDFLTSMPSTPFAPNSAPSGDWIECDTVAPGEFAEFDNLVPGAYAVAEKDPGAAYDQTTGPWAVNVEPGDEDRLAGINGITNEYQLGDITVTKDIELAGGDLPAGSSFTICVEGPSFTDGDCRVFTSDGQAETWTDLIPGAYTVSETGTEPAGVDWATTITNSGNVTVPAGGDASATVTNTLITGDLAVIKNIEWSGFVPAPDTLDDSAAFQPFEICIQGPSYPLGTEAGACQLVTNVNGETLQWENLAAGTYTVTETDPGTIWTVEVDPADAGTAGVVTCAPDDTACETPQVTITNTLAPASLTICKDFVGDETDEGVLPGITVAGQSIDTPWNEIDCFIIEVAPFTPVTVAEVLPEGYFPAQAPILSGACTIQQQEEIVAEFIIAQTLSFLGIEFVEAWLEADLTGIPAGQSCTVTFTNEPVGELVIVKEDNVNSEEPVTWTFDVDNGEVSDAAVIIGSGSDSNTVATGNYTVSEREVDGLNRVDICEVDSPAGSYQVRVQVSGGGPLFGTSAEVAVARGQTTTVTFFNDDCGRILGGANLFVNKFEASAEGAFSGSTGLEGWTMELTCIAGECESGGFPGTLDTDAAGLASFGAVPTGRYEVCEVPQTGYDVVGSLLDGGDSQAGTCREVIVTQEAAGPDGNIVVDFYNYPLGGLRVEKRQLEGGALDVSDNGGWEITVEGCGESFTQTTNEAIPNSWTVFENLPACDDYVVSENVNSKPGYTPVGPASYEFAFNPGDDLVFTFVNDTVPENTPTNTPETGETPTPTNTPETPTNTPEPTETPVDPTETPEEPTSTPTPIDEVEGEITPGPTEDPGSAATPIPPASGTGNSILGAGTGSSMFMVLLALLMTSTGLAALAMARGRANGASRR